MSEDKTADDEDTISVPIPETKAEDTVESGAEEAPTTDEERLERAAVDLADVRAAMESVSRALAVLSNEFERLNTLVVGAENTIIHACPPDGSGLMPCCGRSPIDVPLTERISLDGSTITCTGRAKALPSA